MQINLTKFRELADKRYLSVQKHDVADLLIWNYTQVCQFERYWTEETMMARGLITDLDGNIVARPFKKFFNLSEHTGEDSKLPKLPIEEFEVFDKLDGSLGILYFDQYDQPKIATRGSFTSDQAIKASRILHDKYWKVPFAKTGTYLFEIIYPENRIVVDYGKTEDLFLLTAYATDTGEEFSYDLVKAFARDFKIPVVKRYDFNDLDQIKMLSFDNAEGFVIRFKGGMRVKLKFDEYVRLHRLVTGVNAKTIWELLRNNQPFDELMERVPDEFYQWVKDTKNELENKFAYIERKSMQAHKDCLKYETRKEQALFVIKQYKEFSGIVFKMLDKQPYEEQIWKMIKPRADKPWKEDIDA